ncbi:MAG: hypothetical protein M5U26_25835 [Planctomycetota bacterium]|nr:hypothetical protein [Planctomycetota bacterium]
MSAMLRLLNTTNKGTWLEISVKGFPDWCGENEVPAKLLGDWCDNELSLWNIPDKKVLYQILIALLMPRQEWKHVSYIVFDDSSFREAELRPEKRPGTTKVKVLDSNFHFEVHKVSSGKLARFLRILLAQFKDEKAKIEKITRDDLLGHLRESLHQSYTAETSMKPLVEPMESEGTMTQPSSMPQRPTIASGATTGGDLEKSDPVSETSTELPQS